MVGKGRYKTGDYAVYIPEQAILPDELIEEFDLVGMLAGKEKNRVRAVRLRGEISQGLVVQPDSMLSYWCDPTACKLASENKLDFAGALSIEKWVPAVPAHFAGEMEAAPDLIRWIDIENLYRYPEMFALDEMVVATEKIHGTCCLVTFVRATGEILISSKGLGSRNLALKPTDKNLKGNVYYRAVQAHSVDLAAGELCDALGAEKVAVFGEVFGRGVQDLDYGADSSTDLTIGYRAFDIYVQNHDEGHWLNADVFPLMAEAHGLPTVPELYRGAFDLSVLTELSRGDTELGGGHIREGLVIRPVLERYSPITGGRAIAKVVSPEYLLRNAKTATEFE